MLCPDCTTESNELSTCVAIGCSYRKSRPEVREKVKPKEDEKKPDPSPADISTTNVSYGSRLIESKAAAQCYAVA